MKFYLVFFVFSNFKHWITAFLTFTTPPFTESIPKSTKVSAPGRCCLVPLYEVEDFNIISFISCNLSDSKQYGTPIDLSIIKSGLYNLYSPPS